MCDVGVAGGSAAGDATVRKLGEASQTPSHVTRKRHELGVLAATLALVQAADALNERAQ